MGAALGSLLIRGMPEMSLAYIIERIGTLQCY